MKPDYQDGIDMNTPTQQTGGEAATPRTDAAEFTAKGPHGLEKVVRSVLARHLERETATLHAQIARMKQRDGELESYARFGKELLDQAKLACAEESLGEDDERLLEMAARMNVGGVHQMPYDPSVHQPIDCDPGDLIWSWAPRAALHSVAKEGEQP